MNQRRRNEHRINCAWAAFTRHRQEFTSNQYPLKYKLQWFTATVTPTILHAAGTGALTETMQRQLNTTQGRMTRMIINIPRRRRVHNSTVHKATIHHAQTNTDSPRQHLHEHDIITIQTHITTNIQDETNSCQQLHGMELSMELNWRRRTSTLNLPTRGNTSMRLDQTTKTTPGSGWIASDEPSEQTTSRLSTTLNHG